MLTIAEMPRSSYYYYVKQMKKQDKYALIKAEIEAIQEHIKVVELTEE